jgi:hypothetical protein
MSTLESELRSELRKYLDGDIALHQFEDWFVPILWNIEEYQEPEAQLLAGRIHALISECSRGDRNQESLHEELENAIRPFVPPQVYGDGIEIAIGEPLPSRKTSASSAFRLRVSVAA